MSGAEYFLRGDLEALRRDGSVTTRWATAEEAARWRAGMRRVCRAAELRVRTGASQGQGGTVAWGVHADHVVTAAQAEAASRTIEAALDGEPLPAPFHVLARRAQRKMLRLVPPDAGRTG
ncbi:MAG TPA: hypothetical protein VGS06_34075 [Streptosporangiaceae bacterium]|nr:hypothetical protein [Streptosporangiaceae bacterium]